MERNKAYIYISRTQEISSPILDNLEMVKPLIRGGANLNLKDKGIEFVYNRQPHSQTFVQNWSQLASHRNCTSFDWDKTIMLAHAFLLNKK